MKRRLEIDATLEKRSNGIFEVSLDGELLFSKKALGRFPEPGEVEQLVERRLTAKRMR